MISSALMFLHRRGIIYRDLKCSNILVRKFPDPFNETSILQVHLLLTDYGISQFVFIGGVKGNQGTPGYIAPEIWKYIGKEIYSEKTDCFSFGSFIYELLSLSKPFYNVSHNDIVREIIIDGKRPKLTNKEKKYPALVLSLLYCCWSQNHEDRPSASEINNLTSLNEFQSLVDILELGNQFHLHCVVTSRKNMINHNVISSRCQIGSRIWFCGSLSNRPESVITVFTYNDYKFNHILNLQLKEKVLVACSVGDAMWLGTDLGSIKVYCATSLNLIAIGEFFFNERILCMEHFPLLNFVVVTFSNGRVLSFPDWFMVDINGSYHNMKTSNKSSPTHPFEKIIKLFPSRNLLFEYPIHSMAIVSSNFGLKQNSTNGLKLPTTSYPTEGLELWFGQKNGQVTILNAKTMTPIETISVKSNDIDNAVFNDLTVTFLETPRSYNLLTETINQNCHIWIVTSPGTQVEKWNVDTRQIENIFFANQHVVSLSLNCSETSEKSSITRMCDAHIQSLVVVENSMYVGTSSGSFYVCDAQTMVPHTWLRYYKELISFITPFRMKTGTNEENDKKLILTCGQSYLDQWWRRIDCNNDTSRKEMTVLIWDTTKI